MSDLDAEQDHIRRQVEFSHLDHVLVLGIPRRGGGESEDTLMPSVLPGLCEDVEHLDDRGRGELPSADAQSRRGVWTFRSG